MTAIVCGDDSPVKTLTADQQAAMDSIEESKVLETVSFLASDEMAGRNTPSPELDIAADYVAKRFRSAGLEGLGAEGSFFQPAELKQFVLPDGEFELLAGEKTVETLGMLFTPADAVEVKGSVMTGEKPADSAGKVVVVDDFTLPPQAVANPGMVIASWSRRLAPYANKDAAAVLIRVPQDSILPEVLKEQKGKPMNLPAQFILNIPVILVPVDAVPEGEVTVKTSKRVEAKAVVNNVIGLLRGSDPELSKQAIIVSAHLDHIGVLGGDRGGDVINNGADDNATGVTAVVTLAETFAKLKTRPKRSIILMTFWGEEKGLLGSKYYCNEPLWPLHQTVANINIEMIGRPEVNAEKKMWGTGWTRSTLCQQVADGAKRAGVDVFHREDVSEMLYTRSDNYSFVQKGVIAHSFSAGSLHSDYHQPSDEVSLLNLPHMTAIIKGLYAGVLPIADGELTPTKSEEEK